MKGTTSDHGALTTWIDFVSPDESEWWRFPPAWLLSNWTCLYGNGCPGHFGAQDKYTNPDVGCCSHGVYISSKVELTHVIDRVAELTEEDWDANLIEKFSRKDGEDRWLRVFDDTDEEDPDYFNGKTRTFNNTCVFNNRSDGSVGSTGKIGCAFHHLGQRTERPYHDETMPHACWQLPIGLVQDEEGVNIIRPWDADYWGGSDDRDVYEEDDLKGLSAKEIKSIAKDMRCAATKKAILEKSAKFAKTNDGKHDSWMRWWCVDTPDAYVGGKPLYLSMERELRKIMSSDVYDKMVELLKPYIADGIVREGSFGIKSLQRMPGVVLNEGRPLIPLLVGNRKPKRGMPA